MTPEQPNQQTSSPRRARHLMDPDNPRPAPSSETSLTQVQRWVLSVLAVTTILHFSAGLMAFAIVAPDSRPDQQIGLNILAGVTAVGAVAAGFGIHGRNPLTWWLLLGVLVIPIGLYLTLWL